MDIEEGFKHFLYHFTFSESKHVLGNITGSLQPRYVASNKVHLFLMSFFVAVFVAIFEHTYKAYFYVETIHRIQKFTKKISGISLKAGTAAGQSPASTRADVWYWIGHVTALE